LIHLLALLTLVASHSHAASIFDFNDDTGYEKCLSTDSLEEKFTEGSHTQKRWLRTDEIRERCVKHATQLAEKEKDGARLLGTVDLTRRMAGAQLALPLAQRLVQLKIAYCNEMKVYDLLLKTLQNPTTTQLAKQDFEQARKLVALCVADKTFKSDFMEEQTNADAHIKANACQILKDAKLVTKCGDSK
jgi:hypothetical protein